MPTSKSISRPAKPATPPAGFDAKTLIRRFLKPVVFIAALSPALWMTYELYQALFQGVDNSLGANPVQAAIRWLGDKAILFIMIALAVTPVRRVTGWTEIVRLRRMLGLFAFFYAILHLFAYIGLDQQFDWHAIGVDILKRIYITVGMAVITILTALAVTSPRAVVRWMGGKNWRKLHRLVYLAGIGAVVHYYMLVKADTRDPLLYGALLVGLFILRLPNPGKWMARPARIVSSD